LNIQALLVVLVLGGGMIGAGVFLVKGQIDQRVAAEVAATAERTRADLAEAQVDRLEDALEDDRERQAELRTELQAARTREDETTEVLEDRARLESLTQAKPGLLERLARRATTKVWEDIEVVARE
jgi:predicted  nucleic acid-binding Zn-ribbon protein